MRTTHIGYMIIVVNYTSYTIILKVCPSVCMYVCLQCIAVRLKAPKRNGLASWKNLQSIITQRLGQRDYFQFAILFKRRYMAILNLTFQRAYFNTAHSKAICSRHACLISNLTSHGASSNQSEVATGEFLGQRNHLQIWWPNYTKLTFFATTAIADFLGQSNSKLTLAIRISISSQLLSAHNLLSIPIYGHYKHAHLSTSLKLICNLKLRHAAKYAILRHAGQRQIIRLL